MATGDNALTGIWVSQKWGIMNSEEYFIADLNNEGTEIIWESEFRNNIVKGDNEEENTNAEFDKISLAETVSMVHPSRNASEMSKSASQSSTSSNKYSRSRSILIRLMNE